MPLTSAGAHSRQPEAAASLVTRSSNRQEWLQVEYWANHVAPTARRHFHAWSGPVRRRKADALVLQRHAKGESRLREVCVQRVAQWQRPRSSKRQMIGLRLARPNLLSPF